MTEKVEDAIPKGMVKTIEGDIIPRDKCVFLLRRDEVNTDVERAMDGTVYLRDPKTGALRRMTPKKGERRKKWKR